MEGLVNHRHFYWKPIHYSPAFFNLFISEEPLKLSLKPIHWESVEKCPLYFCPVERMATLQWWSKCHPYRQLKKNHWLCQVALAPNYAGTINSEANFPQLNYLLSISGRIQGFHETLVENGCSSQKNITCIWNALSNEYNFRKTAFQLLMAVVVTSTLHAWEM